MSSRESATANLGTHMLMVTVDMSAYDQSTTCSVTLQNNSDRR